MASGGQAVFPERNAVEQENRWDLLPHPQELNTKGLVESWEMDIEMLLMLIEDEGEQALDPEVALEAIALVGKLSRTRDELIEDKDALDRAKTFLLLHAERAITSAINLARELLADPHPTEMGWLRDTDDMAMLTWFAQESGLQKDLGPEINGILEEILEENRAILVEPVLFKDEELEIRRLGLTFSEEKVDQNRMFELSAEKVERFLRWLKKQPVPATRRWACGYCGTRQPEGWEGFDCSWCGSN
jgi:hypothetical protein